LFHIISKQVDVNGVSAEGTTAFCFACWQGQKEVCQTLVKHGADPLLINTFGCGAGLWAVQGGREVSFLRFLHEEMNVPFDYLNHNKHSALHKAGQRGLQNVCEWLINTVGLKDPEYFQESHDEKSTPATLARFSGAVELADWLATFEPTR
jgi:ankyrin repeat protein